MTFLTPLMDMIAPLKKHIDDLVFHLPWFVLQQDRKIYGVEGGAVAVELEKFQSAYCQCFSLLEGMNHHLGVMDQYLDELRTLLGVDRKKDFSGMAMTLGAGFVFPAFLVKAGVKAIRLYKLNADDKENVKKIHRNVLNHWNYLVGKLLPLVSFQVLEVIFDLRVSHGQVLRNYWQNNLLQRQNLSETLASRYAALETFLLFRASVTGADARRDLNAFVYRLWQEVESPPFKAF